MSSQGSDFASPDGAGPAGTTSAGAGSAGVTSAAAGSAGTGASAGGSTRAAGEPEGEGRFELTLKLQDGYRFLATFDGEELPALAMDEPPPLGEGTAPNAARVLAASIGDCLSASALYCLRRARVEVHDMRTTVHGSLLRNEAGRLRIGAISVQIEPVVDADQQPRMKRCLELFEDFCVVTQSVRSGIDVDVTVEPAERRGPA